MLEKKGEKYIANPFYFKVVLGLNCKDNCMVEATSCLASGEERSSGVLFPKRIG